MLFFGIIRKYKGLDTLMLKHLQMSVYKVMNLKLIVAGEFYENDKPYLDLITKYNLSDSLVLHTRILFLMKDVVNYFCAADMIAQTYRTCYPKWGYSDCLSF